MVIGHVVEVGGDAHVPRTGIGHESRSREAFDVAPGIVARQHHDSGALLRHGGHARAEAALLRRCVRSARLADVPVAADALPAPIVTAISARLAEADPLADLRLGFSCPACSHAWSDPLDIVAYLWRELDSWALRVLREVHTLAHAYGWTEDTILGLSPARRRHYLDLVAA